MTFLCAKNALQRHFAWLEMPIYIFSATVLLLLRWGGRSCRRALFGGFHLVTDSGLFVGIWWISKILMINAAKQNRYRLHYIFGWNTDKLLVMYINWLVVIIILVKYLVLLNYLEVSPILHYIYKSFVGAAHQRNRQRVHASNFFVFEYSLKACSCLTLNFASK